MCRMIAAPSGILGEGIIEPFVRMARGKNALHEHNTTLGEFQHPDGWASCTRRKDRSSHTVASALAGRTTISHGSRSARSSSCTHAALRVGR